MFEKLKAVMAQKYIAELVKTAMLDHSDTVRQAADPMSKLAGALAKALVPHKETIEHIIDDISIVVKSISEDEDVKHAFKVFEKEVEKVNANAIKKQGKLVKILDKLFK